MPYENEHSARLRDPGDFDENPKWKDGKPGKFRRTDDGKLYAKIKVPNTVSIIWGKLKDKAGLKDPPVPQALRFAKGSWTVEKARQWLKDNGVEYISFEPAKGKEKHELPDADAAFGTPAENPYIFTMPGEVEFAASDDIAKKNLRPILYDGSIVKHWYWGFLAFEQKTMRMAKKRNPILFSHDVGQRIAYSDKAVFEPKFVMEGPFLKSSQTAEDLRSQMEEGFPFEGSLRFDPNQSDIDLIKEGESVTVNGHRLKGPGTVVRNALILEGSVCVFGALKNTKSQAFASNPFFKEITMPEETTTKMTVEELTAENLASVLPEIHAHVLALGKAQGEQAIKQQFTELQKICGDDAALTIQCFAEGKTSAEASQLKMAKLQAEAKRLTEENTALKAKKLDPAITEFSDTAPAPGTEKKFDPSKATDEQLKEHFAKTQEIQDQFSSVEAYIAAVRHPAK